MITVGPKPSLALSGIAPDHPGTPRGKSRIKPAASRGGRCGTPKRPLRPTAPSACRRAPACPHNINHCPHVRPQREQRSRRVNSHRRPCPGGRLDCGAFRAPGPCGSPRPRAGAWRPGAATRSRACHGSRTCASAPGAGPGAASPCFRASRLPAVPAAPDVCQLYGRRHGRRDSGAVRHAALLPQLV